MEKKTILSMLFTHRKDIKVSSSRATLDLRTHCTSIYVILATI